MNTEDINEREEKFSPSTGHEHNDSPPNNDTGDNTSSNSDSENSETTESSFEGKKIHEKKYNTPPWASKMLNLAKEIAVMLLVAVTYAAFTTDPPKISKSPSAYPFFERTSPVTDWYRGHITKAIEQARTSDIAFVMFYAPWDAECQYARAEFEIAAKYLSKSVTFTAVNCWQPGSECRIQYSKVYKWPVLIAYPTHGRGIQYNGPLQAPHMIKFLQSVSRPFTRINERLQPEADAFVYVEVDPSRGNYDYAVAYSVSLRLLERDPFRDIPFLIRTIPPGQMKSFAIVMWNETLFYNEDEWKTDQILIWVKKHLLLVSSWLSPSGMKSLSLSNYMKPGPALIMFTPKNPLVPNYDLKTMLNIIGYNYYRCHDTSSDISRLNFTNNFVKFKRIGNFLKYKELKEKCSEKEDLKMTRILSKTTTNLWMNNSCCFFNNDCTNCDIKTVQTDCKLAVKEECLDTIFRDKEENCDKADNEIYEEKYYKTSMLNGKHDPRSSENLQKQYQAEECRNFHSAEHYQPQIFSTSLWAKNFSDYSKISGLSCKTNKSLTILAMDSLMYYHFAEKLGIDIFAKKNKTAVVILNNKLETHHIMDGPINDETFKDFLYNFTTGLLDRSLKSNVNIKSKNTHSYGEKYNCSNGRICIKELNTHNFLPTIMEQDQAVIVMYYSKQCSFCNGISYTFLTAAKKFSHVNKILFARIDGDINLLPWEYTMESYPTILFIPAGRKPESRAFPKNIPVTVENLIGFILTNLDMKLKLQAMWSICNETQFKLEKEVCFSSVRAEILSIIETTLRQWRSAQSREKPKILRKLQLLKHLHLLFAHNPQAENEIQTCLNKLNIVPYNCDHDNSFNYKPTYLPELDAVKSHNIRKEEL